MSRSRDEFLDVLNDGGAEAVLSVSTTAVEAKASTAPLVGREMLYIENRGPQEIFYGPSVTPTASLKKSQFVYLPVGELFPIYLITASGTSDVVVQEWA